MRYESVANRKFCKKDEGIMENKRLRRSGSRSRQPALPKIQSVSQAVFRRAHRFSEHAGAFFIGWSP